MKPPADYGWYSSGSRGAAAELLACVHFMRTGCHVFRSESPASPFDLVILRDDCLIRVEVKSLTWPKSDPSRFLYNPGPTFAWPTNDNWDICVVVNTETSVCHEFSTHDRREARDFIRAQYGFDPHVPLSQATSDLRLRVLDFFADGSDLEFSQSSVALEWGCTPSQLSTAINYWCEKGTIERVKKGVFRLSQQQDKQVS